MRGVSGDRLHLLALSVEAGAADFLLLQSELIVVEAIGLVTLEPEFHRYCLATVEHAAVVRVDRLEHLAVPLVHDTVLSILLVGLIAGLVGSVYLEGVWPQGARARIDGSIIGEGGAVFEDAHAGDHARTALVRASVVGDHARLVEQVGARREVMETVGLVAPIVTSKTSDGLEICLPALVAVAVTARTPSSRALVVIEYLPPVAVPEPFSAPSTRILTVELSSAVPVKVGVVSLVILSVLDAPSSEVPLSLSSARSGVEGAAVVD